MINFNASVVIFLMKSISLVYKKSKLTSYKFHLVSLPLYVTASIIYFDI